MWFGIRTMESRLGAVSTGILQRSRTRSGRNARGGRAAVDWHRCRPGLRATRLQCASRDAAIRGGRNCGEWLYAIVGSANCISAAVCRVGDRATWMFTELFDLLAGRRYLLDD
jgi:hypothetical protein